MITPQGFQATSTCYTNTYVSTTNSTGGSTYVVLLGSGDTARIVYRNSCPGAATGITSGPSYLTLGYNTNYNSVSVIHDTYGNYAISFGNYGFPSTYYGSGNATAQFIEAIVGPGFIRCDNCNDGGTVPGIVTVQITRNNETITPSGAVTVPSDSIGSVQVILESSTNLATWSSALPGTYGSTRQNMYFRVRAVNQVP